MPKSELQVDIDNLRRQLAILELKVGEQYVGPLTKDAPIKESRVIVQAADDPGYTNRVLVATPTTGIVRMEWVAGRYGQVIPCNWSYVQMNQWMGGYIPLGYQVADAQNLIVREVVLRDMEWLVLLEHDTIPPADAFVRFNTYMVQERVPVVSGLYYTRSRPAEPLVYRGRGTSYYVKWKFGDKVWCDGVPTGCLLIHSSILRTMWNESDEYDIRHADGRIEKVRRVFNTPRVSWFDPETGQFNSMGGTSDLDWCSRVIKNKIFEKAGWPDFQKKKYPFLVDTNIFCKHIDIDGTIYP